MNKTFLIRLFIGIIGVMAFLGCERPEPIDPTEGQPQTGAEDSLINQQGNNNDSNASEYHRPIEHWSQKAFLSDTVYDVTIMDIYPNDSVLYAINLDSTGWYGVAWGYGRFTPYSMSGDTITVYYQDDYGLPDELKRWIIYRWNDTTMYWKWLGSSPNNPPDYVFYLNGIEQ